MKLYRALVSILVVLTAVTAVAYENRLERSAQDLSASQAEVARVTANRDDISTSLADAQRQIRQYADVNKALLNPYRLTEPPMAFWTGEWTLAGGSKWVYWTLPDTFTVTFGFTSSMPITVYVMGLNDYVCFASAGCAWRAEAVYGPTTSLSGAIFHGAEGCGGYVSVWLSGPGTLHANVWGTRNAAPALTGACR